MLARLQSSGLRVRYVTNTTKESKKRLFQRLQKMGFHNISPEQIFTSLSAAKHMIVERQLNPLLLVDDEATEDWEVLSKRL